MRAADLWRQVRRTRCGRVIRRGGWALGWAAIRVLLPAVMLVVQARGWAMVWHRITDRVVVWKVQAGALAVGFGLLWLFGVNTVTAVLTVPAWLLLSFGVGRVLYPLTWRGRARSMYDPDGWARWAAVRREMSAHAVKQTSLFTRPSVKARVTTDDVKRPSAWLLARLPVSECGTWLGKTAIGTSFGVHCYAPHEAAVGLIAPPRKWKTALMGHHIIDAPGAVLATQTKPETYVQTRELRRRKSASGRVELLDPEGLTGEPSTFRWSPITGCRDPKVAMQMAAALAAAADGPGEDSEWFEVAAATVLQFFLLIADVTGRTMSDVYLWSAGAAFATPALAAATEHSDEVPAGWAEAAIGTLTTEAKRTRDSILMTLAGAVGFMADPSTAQLCTPDPEAAPFDVAGFLADRGTIYLIASEREHAKVGPLLAAFTEYLFEDAKRIAARSGGRLDPPLSMSLDEVANTIPMPLHRWVADAGGRGIHIGWSAQSRSQLRDKWGTHGADTIWNATTVKLISGGITVEDDLRGFSELCGTRWDDEGDGPAVQVPVMTAGDVRRIPKWHALLIHDVSDATLLRVSPVWARKDVLAATWLPTTPRTEALPAITGPVTDETPVYVPEQWHAEPTATATREGRA